MPLVGVGDGADVGAAPMNEPPTPATASAIAMRATLRRKYVVRLFIVPVV